MTRGDDGDRVPIRSPSNGPRSIRIAYLSGNIAIRTRFAERDRKQGFPNLFLEIAAHKIQFQRECPAFFSEILPELPLRFYQNRVCIVLLPVIHGGTFRIVPFPKHRAESLIACHQGKLANR
ncbi:hypothetical protein D3C87_1819360 [compost metagenome]